MALPTWSETLNDFGLGVLKDTDKKEPRDIITPNNALWKRMQGKNGGMIQTRAPGKGPVEDVMYQTPDRGKDASFSNDMIDDDYSSVESTTEAKYDWCQRHDFLMIPGVYMDNAQGANALGEMLIRKRRPVNQSHQNFFASAIWNGRVSGSEKVFGITDFVQYAPGTSPTKGTIGGLDASTGAQFASVWQNQVADFEAPYKVIGTGGQVSTDLFSANPTNSMLGLWMRCSNNVQMATPDIGPCNDVFWTQITDLVETKQVYVDDITSKELGTDVIKFKGMDIFWDPNCPTEVTAEGACYFLNTDYYRWLNASGLVGEWSPAEKVPGKYAWYYRKRTQYSATVDSRRVHGVLIGVQAHA